MKKAKKLTEYIMLILLAGLTALNYKIFVFPNSFAPAGVDGVCTMIQQLLGTSMGYFSLLVNIPLLAVGFFILDKRFVKRTVVYTVCFSLVTILLNRIDMTPLLYDTENGTSIVLAPIAGGVIRGLIYAATLRLNGSAGGIDIIAAIVKRYKPHYQFMNIIFALNVMIAFSSYFVYGFQLEPVICSILYSFVTSKVSKSVAAKNRENIRFEMITEDAEGLCHEISDVLRIPSTVIEAKGGYSGDGKKMVICVTDKESAPNLETILKKYKGSVLFENTVTASEKIKKY